MFTFSIGRQSHFLQESASLHAESLGFGKGDFAAAGENSSWVLTRMVVKMNRYPVWEDELTVETFPRGGRKIVAWCDFEVKDAKGQTFAGDEVRVETAASDGFTYHRVSAPDGKDHIVERTKD